MRLLESALCGRGIPIDVSGGSDGAHDFDVVLDDRVIGVEVTRVTDPRSLALLREVQKKIWDAPELGCSWSIAIEGHTKIAGLPDEVRTILKNLEDLGVLGFERDSPNHHVIDGPDRDEPRELIHRLQRAGVVSGSQIFAGEPITIFVGWQGGSGFVNPNGLNSAIRECIDAKLPKMRNIKGKDERHLFVWLDPHAALRGVPIGRIPDTMLALPPGIDTVWVALETYDRLQMLIRGDKASDQWASIVQPAGYIPWDGRSSVPGEPDNHFVSKVGAYP